MASRDWFALGVRLFGVWLITGGAVYVAAFVDAKLYPASGPARDSAAANLIYATLDFALAAFFLLWTGPFPKSGVSRWPLIAKRRYSPSS